MSLLEFLTLHGLLYTETHIVYSSGKHGDTYANLRPLGLPEHAESFREYSYSLLAKAIIEGELNPAKPILVVGPETLGAKMAKTAVGEYNRRHNTQLQSATFTATKHDDGSKTFSWSTDNWGINYIQSETQIIWMDDLLNLSSTLARTRDIIEGLAKIFVVAVFFDRSHLTAVDLKVSHLVSLVKHQMPAHDEGRCPLCMDYVPIVTYLGHGKQFQDKHPEYPGGYKLST